MAIKIPNSYSYKVYRHSDLATFVDKYTHNPRSCSFPGILHFAVITGVLLIIYNVCSDDMKEQLKGPFVIALIVCFVFFFFIYPFILPHISDHFRWAEKIAQREARKKSAFFESITDHDHMMKQAAGENEWKCPSCGRVNQNYVGTCGCGMTKAEAVQAESFQDNA